MEVIMTNHVRGNGGNQFFTLKAEDYEYIAFMNYRGCGYAYMHPHPLEDFYWMDIYESPTGIRYRPMLNKGENKLTEGYDSFTFLYMEEVIRRLHTLNQELPIKEPFNTTGLYEITNRTSNGTLKKIIIDYGEF